MRGEGAIIEIGAGIGTITDLVSTKIDNQIYTYPLVCYEKNEWCISQLKNNILREFVLIQNISEISSLENLFGKKVFLMIDDYINFEQTQLLLEHINPRYVIIEGHRFGQRITLAKILLTKSFYIRFFGNSLDSVKGACVINIWGQQRNLLSFFSYLRLRLQSTLLARKFLQAIGIRTRKFMEALTQSD